MARLKLQDEINQIKTEIQKLLTSLFGVDTNLAPLQVQSVFEHSKKRIEESLALKGIFQPHLEDYIKTLNIPDEFKNINMDSALELVQNNQIDIKNFLPILKTNLDNNHIKDIFHNGVPGTGAVLKELGQTLSHITGPTQKAPSFIKDFLTSDSRNTLGDTNIQNIIDPSFASLDPATRTFIASAAFTEEPSSLLTILQSNTNLPKDLSSGLIENSTNPSAFLTGYVQKTDLTKLNPHISNALLDGSFEKASPIMLDLLTVYAPTVAPLVKLAIGSGALSGLEKDASDFISHPKLNTITDTMRGYVGQVLSKAPIDSSLRNTVGKIIENKADITGFLNDVSKKGIKAIDFNKYGLPNLTINEAQKLLSSDLNLPKLAKQINKLSFSQIPNEAISQLLNQGATQGDLFKIGSLLDSGIGSKLSGITDLLGSNALGKDLSSLENSINKLKGSFLNLDILGTLSKSDHTTTLINEIVDSVPIGTKDPTDTLTRIGPVVNEHTYVTLEKKGDLFTKATALIQRKFPRDFSVRGPAQKQPSKKPYDPRSPLIIENEEIGQDIPKTNPTEYPDPGSFTH